MKVLFTREMSDAEQELAGKLGIDPISLPLIGFQFVGWDEILSEHPEFWDQLSAAKAVVFTSRNGVRGVTSWTEYSTNDQPDFDNNRELNNPGKTATAENQPDFIEKIATKDAKGATNEATKEIENAEDSVRINTEGYGNLTSAKITSTFIDIIKKKPVYTVGETTADALEPFGILARFPDDYNATTLAKMMLMDGVHSRIIHFCGDVRRPELGLAMKDAGIDVHELVVYKKQELYETNLVNSASFDGVVFYSPSAVHAFFGQNLNENFHGSWFAIGQTTASALRELGIEPLVPRAPTSELMIEFVAKHFKTVN